MNTLAKICCVACLMMVAACGIPEAAGKIVQVIADPDVPVGEAEEQPSVVELHVYAAAEMNRNFEGEPSPVVVNVYALKSDHRFFTFDFFSIVDNPEETLGVTLIEELDENMIEPDTYKVLGPYELPAGTQKIAVIAQYLDIETVVWRDALSVDAIGTDDELLILLLEEEIRMIEGEG